MQKRKIVIGTYDTALEGLWTLTSWALSSPELRESYIEVPGRNGSLDVSTALTDGEPYYGNRSLEATFESSEGTRLEREDRISQMINKLDGLRLNIILPDDSMHYISGRVRVEKIYNDLAHASVRVTATCDPWRYNNSETVVSLAATSTEQTVALINNGRRSVVPTIKVQDGSVLLKVTVGDKTSSWTLDPREHILGDVYIKSGSLPITYSGSGQITLTYREAVL